MSGKGDCIFRGEGMDPANRSTQSVWKGVFEVWKWAIGGRVPGWLSSARRARSSVGSSCGVMFLLSAGVVLGEKGYIPDLPFTMEKESMKKRRPFWTYSCCRGEGFHSGPLHRSYASAGTR